MSEPEPEPMPSIEAATEQVYLKPSSLFYFHHVVTPETATLNIEVVGPNLAVPIRHLAPKGCSSKSVIRHELEQKTVGFLVLIEPDTEQRAILAWAESGQGKGTAGDVRSSQHATILPNRIWTRRAVKVGRLLGLTMGHPYDAKVTTVDDDDPTGYWLCSHVEIKLATHAILSLLKMTGITTDLDAVKGRHFRALSRIV
jgi:hypothetical protein